MFYQALWNNYMLYFSDYCIVTCTLPSILHTKQVLGGNSLIGEGGCNCSFGTDIVRITCDSSVSTGPNPFLSFELLRSPFSTDLKCEWLKKIAFYIMGGNYTFLCVCVYIIYNIDSFYWKRSYMTEDKSSSIHWFISHMPTLTRLS